MCRVRKGVLRAHREQVSLAQKAVRKGSGGRAEGGPGSDTGLPEQAAEAHSTLSTLGGRCHAGS